MVPASFMQHLICDQIDLLAISTYAGRFFSWKSLEEFVGPNSLTMFHAVAHVAHVLELIGKSEKKYISIKKGGPKPPKRLPTAAVVPTPAVSSAVTVADDRTTVTIVARSSAETSAVGVTDQSHLFDIRSDICIRRQTDWHSGCCSR
jgi:hypothetical protein